MVKPRPSEKEAKWMVTGDCNCPLLSIGRSARPASDALAAMGIDVPVNRQGSVAFQVKPNPLSVRFSHHHRQPI